MANTNLRNVLNSVAGVRPESTSELTFSLKENQFSSLIDNSNLDPVNFSKNLGYHFRVIRNNKNPNMPVGRFTLQINPQQLQQNEDFAIQITPSQQGIVVEHQGSILKELMISGTTGFTPTKGLGGVTRDGVARGSRGVTGYEQFHRFRNFIANYVELKKDPNNRDLRLIFENPKDGDFFIVEPIKFTKDRKSPQKTLYFYNAVFKILGRLVDDLDQSEVDSLTQRLSNIKQGVSEALAFMEDVEGTLLASAELIQGVSRDFNAIILTPLRSVTSALRAFNQGKSIVVDLPRRTFLQLRDSARSLRENLVETVGVDLSLYNSLSNRTSTVQNTLSETTFEHYNLLNSFRKLERGLNIVLSDNKFFGAQTLSDKGRQYTTSYSTNLNLPVVSTAKLTEVLNGDTIQTIAARELGTARRYKELIILNDLTPPYISETGGNKVLKPGDTIMIPNIGEEQISNLIVSNKDYPITQSVPINERPLGIDLAVDSNFDLVFTNTSDLDLVGGKNNAIQALRILMALEKGSLKLFPNVGADLKIGERIKNDLAFVIQQDLIRTVLTSPKFVDAKFKILIEAGTLNIEGFVGLKNFDLGIPIDINVPIS